MKAIGFEKTGGPDEICLLNVPEPKIEVGKILLRFKAGALNHLDLWVLKGLPRVQYSFPHIAGADFCGEVVESKTPCFKPGERVIVYPATGSKAPENLQRDFKIRGENTTGVFSELLLVDEKYVFSAPKHLSDSEAAALPLVYLTAWQMVMEKADAERMDRSLPVLVHGAGSGVTQAILELLLSLGFSQIATTSRDPSKLKAWEKRGIKTFISDLKLEENLKAFAGADRMAILFDHIGEKFFEMNIRLLRAGGKFITCGATSGEKGFIDLRHLYFRQLQLLGSTMGSLAHFHAMLDWVSKHQIRPHVSQEFKLSDAAKAYKMMENGAQDGKLVIVT